MLVRAKQLLAAGRPPSGGRIDEVLGRIHRIECNDDNAPWSVASDIIRFAATNYYFAIESRQSLANAGAEILRSFCIDDFLLRVDITGWRLPLLRMYAIQPGDSGTNGPS